MIFFFFFLSKIMMQMANSVGDFNRSSNSDPSLCKLMTQMANSVGDFNRPSNSNLSLSKIVIQMANLSLSVNIFSSLLCWVSVSGRSPLTDGY